MINQLFDAVSVFGAKIPNQSIVLPLKTAKVQWPGGKGWIQITGVFVGGAKLGNFSVTVPVPTGMGSSSGLVIPVTLEINASGVYEFEAPEGILSGALLLEEGDYVLTLSAYVLK